MVRHAGWTHVVSIITLADVRLVAAVVKLYKYIRQCGTPVKYHLDYNL
jgi:hypothetical protein